MRNIYVEFKFNKKARLIQLVNLLFKGKVYTYLTPEDIYSINKHYEQKR